MEKTFSVNLEKLGDKNYETWRLQMRNILIFNDLWGYVNGDLKIPSDETKAAEWKIKNAKALALIQLHLKDNQIGHVRKTEKAQEAWKILENIHASKTPLKKVMLYKKLFRMKKRNDQNMQQYIKDFQDIVDQLEEMNIKIPEELTSIMLLSSLPDNYENFCIAMETRDTLPSLDTLKTKILEEESRRDSQNIPEESNSQNALISKEKQYNNKNNNRKQYKQKFNGNCFICNKQGHKASNCKNKKNTGKDKEKEKGDNAAMLSVLKVDSLQPNEWYLDSGASAHICNDKSKFVEWNNNDHSIIETAGNDLINSYGSGSVTLKISKDYCKVNRVILKNVIYAPKLKYNLISVPKIVENGYKVIFDKDYASIRNKYGELIFKAQKRDKLYTVKTYSHISLYSKNFKNDILKWHQRFGHLNFSDLRKLENNQLVKGLNVKFAKMDIQCEICERGKMTQLPYKQANHHEDELLGTVHSDICGPISVNSLSGCKYFITFVDEKSRYIEIAFLKSRSDALNAFKNFQVYAEPETNLKIKRIRTDNAKEYVSKEFEEYLKSQGIQHQLSSPYTPQQNGIAERVNRTLFNMARCMLLESNLPKSLWAEAINCAAFIRNRCPTSAIEDKTPYEMWTRKVPHVGFLKTFGCTAIVLKKGPSCSKLDARGDKYILVGYCKNSKAYRLWDGHSRSVIVSRDVKFLEKIDPSNYVCNNLEFLNNDVTKDSSEIKTENIKEELLELETDTDLNGELKGEEKLDDMISGNIDSGQEALIKIKEDSIINKSNEQEVENHATDVQIERQNDSDSDGYETATEDVEMEPTCSASSSRGRPRIIRTGKRGRPRKEKTKKVNLVIDHNNTNPISFEDAIKSPENKKWKEAIRSELSSLEENKTWIEVDRPKDKTVLSNRWVFSIKYKEDGSIDKYKARLVARGCEQRCGLDYDEVYAPVARYETIRVLFGICANKEMHLHQMDVITAFVQGDLQDEVYMEMPQVPDGQANSDKVCKLLKPLYGLKQASREWHKKLDNFLKTIGLRQSSADPCLYSMNKDDKIIIIVVYVDDLLIASNNLEFLIVTKQKLSNKFKMKDLGKINYILGISVHRESDTGCIEISQRRYIEKLLDKFNMSGTKTVCTPVDTSCKLTKDQCPTTEDEILEMKQKPYRELVGALIYLSNTTRPDIAFIASSLSRFCINPGKEHWIAAKRVLKYLKYTIDFKMVYRKSEECINSYVDSDWAGDICDRKSCSGYIIMIAGAPVIWKSKKQKCVALSTMEAEYIALCEAAKEVVYLRRLFNDLGFKEYYDRPTPIYCDNQSAIKFSKDNVHHDKSKHIDIKYHYSREVQAEGVIKISYTSSSNMIADVLTKGLDKIKHKNCIDLLLNFENHKI